MVFAPGRDQSGKYFLPSQDPARFCVVPGKFSGPETNALDRLGRVLGGVFAAVKIFFFEHGPDRKFFWFGLARSENFGEKPEKL